MLPHQVVLGVYIVLSTVTISLRIAWRRTYSWSLYCTQSTINSGLLIGVRDYLNCRVGCSGSIGDIMFKCTDFSQQEDWTTGERSYTYTFPNTSPALYQASFTGRDWIALVQGGGGWEVRVYFNLTRRNDTGRLNTSPITAMMPILRLQYGCNYTIVIPVTDADKDVVRCRWAVWSKSECSGVCMTFPGAVLNENKCQIQYSARGSLGWYAVALMIEDFSSPLSTEPLSSVPLQFLVKVFRSNEACQSRPDFTGTTRADGSCIGVPFTKSYVDSIIARSIGVNNRIVEITTVSPPGLTKTSVSQYATDVWHVNVTWTPSQSQLGPNIFCFSALDANGLTSPQRCVTLLGGVASPVIVTGSQSPRGLIYPTHQKWLVTFDQQFVRPKRSNYIRILRSDGTEVYRVDVATSNTVVYPAGSVGRTVEFSTSYRFAESQTYYVTMDPGIVKGMTYCGAESPPVRDPFFWRVKIRDITRPTVTFLSSPSLTRAENITFTWRTNEQATIKCVITAPSHTFASPCNYSWTGTGLPEGNYRIYVTATDNAGNTAPTRSVSWTVDRTPPTPFLRDKPSNVTRATSASFRFACDSDGWFQDGCYYECSVTLEGIQPSSYNTCSSSFTTNNLDNDRVYVFWLKSRDRAGNQASVLTHKWRIDRKAPSISGLKNLTAACTGDLSPSSTGKPSVTDNEDPSPTLTYEDLPLRSHCGVLRVWKATDRAGNTATGSQKIYIINPTPPVVKYDRRIVLACSIIGSDPEGINKAINVTHPCNLPTNITYDDSVPTMHCGTTFTRTWMITDDCGYKITAPQSIQILNLHLPDYPKNRQVNVGFNQELSWPQYPGAVQYKVYVWKYATNEPKSPTAILSRRTYNPNIQPYPQGNKMLWKVQYVLSSGQVIPSPVWGFRTRPYLDFKVEAVTVPPSAFSGQSLTVSWSVRNIGGIGNRYFRWHDRVYIGKTTLFSDSRFVTSAFQHRILDANDGYTQSATVTLKNEDIGAFYVFVVTYNLVDDIDSTNNKKMGSRSVMVSLTPPPNLKVDSIVIPSSTFSGQSIAVRWVVSNHGLGVTQSSRWYDRLYLSRDNKLGRDDITLQEFEHRGQLYTGSSYSRRETVRVPHAIFGNFTILVKTDIWNNVFEYTAKGDNFLASQTLKIILTPPPDLVVSAIDVSPSTLTTGSTATITYQVTNKGFGPPFDNMWIDQLSITHMATNYREVLGTEYFSGVLPAQGSYLRKVTFVVRPRLKTGQYIIYVHTDVRNQVFEHTAKNNNIKQISTTVIQAIPDLTVPDTTAKVHFDSVSAYVHLNYTIQNVGEGNTYGAPWYDGVFISMSAIFSLETVKALGEIPRKENLPSAQRYTVQEVTIRIPREIFGLQYIFVNTDVYMAIFESNKSNNVARTKAIQIPRILSDLAVQSVSLPQSSQLYADTSVTVTWIVKNRGPGSALDAWYDVLYLARTNTSGPSDRKIYETKIQDRIPPGNYYSHSATFTLPEDANGSFCFILKTNMYGNIKETYTGNNIGLIPVTIALPPLPDLKVVGVSYYYEATLRLLSINWLVKNTAYSMTSSETWSDEILLSPTVEIPIGQDPLGSKSIQARLSSQQELGASTTFHLPRGLSGTFYVHVIANSKGKLKENAKGKGNHGYAVIPVKVTKIQPPTLQIRISTKLPSNITRGEKIPFIFKIQNTGSLDAKQDSWTDAVYVYHSSGASFVEVDGYGVRLALITHMGGLLVNKTYKVNVSITIPYQTGSLVYLYVFNDIYNRTNSMMTNRAVSSATEISAGPLPDLQGAFTQSSLQTRGGQPYRFNFNLTNTGPGLARGTWFNVLYLSQDVLLDPFDIKLALNKISMVLASSSSILVEVEVFVPYDTLRGDYYFLLIVDSNNRVFETNEDNNLAYVLVQIQKPPTADLLVTSVSTQPQILEFGSNVKVDWKLRNNGTLLAFGYKCDSVYLSQDENWQITDTSVGRPKCSEVNLKPYNGGLNQDTPYYLASTIPILPPGRYRGLVKSRSNIRDIHPDNNIKAGPRNINITVPTLKLGKCILVNASREVYIIRDVPSDETLVVTVRTKKMETMYDLYLRHDKPATAFEYDSSSKFALSANQDSIIQSTRKGSYYVLLHKSDNSVNSFSNATICAKLAKFEISKVSPQKVAPLGNATLKIEGTLFGWSLEAHLVNKDNKTTLKASRLYRFSSTQVYATFDITGLALRSVLHVRLTDRGTGRAAILNNCLTMKEGIPGKISLSLHSPRVLRAFDTGFVSIGYQNIGDNDLVSPMLMFTASTMALARLVQNGRLSSPYSQSFLLIAQPLEGPGGILPPKSSGKITLKVKQYSGRVLGRSRLSVDYFISNNKPHMFVDMSNELKPSHVSQKIWEPVWRNFISSVGTTQKSLNQRLSDVATQLSLEDRRVYSVRELVGYQISFANGAQCGTKLLDIIDVADTIPRVQLILRVERVYSPLLTKRHDSGPFGIGWIAPWWEINVALMKDTIKILKSRDEIVFYKQQPARYVSTNKQEVVINGTDILFNDVLGGGETFVFDSNRSRLKSIRSADLNHTITVTAYTTDGRPRELTHSSGGKLTVTFNTRGLIREAVLFKASGERTTSLYAYDPESTLLTSVTTDDKTASYKYTRQRDLESMTYPNGEKLRYSYNRFGLLERMVSYSSNGTKFQDLQFDYDWNGVLTTTSKVDGGSVTVVFDENTNGLSIAGPDGIPIRTQSWLGDHDVTRKTLYGDQILQKRVFNINKKTMTVENANGDQMSYVMREDGRPINITDPSGNVYRSTYNENDMMVESKFPDGSKETFDYDSEGRLDRRTTRNGKHIQFAYREDGILAKISGPDIGPVYYLHDSRGNIIMATNKVGTIRLRYNSNNKPISVTYPDGRYLQYRYNSIGQRIALTETTTGYNISYHYDTFNRLSEVRKGGAQETVLMKVQYDSSGKYEKRVLGNGATSHNTLFQGTTRLKELRNVGPSGRECSRFVYEYDLKGRPTSIKTSHGSRLLKYDSVSQLVGWKDSRFNDSVLRNNSRYGYDSRKNRVYDLDEITGDRVNYVSNSVNQYTSAGEYDFGYDKNGNMVLKKSRKSRAKNVQYVFSEENVMLQIKTANERCDYEYDGLGLLYKKKCANREIRYIMDPFGIFGENTIAQISGDTTTHFVHAEEKGLVALMENNQTLYYQFNGEGSVVTLMKDSCETPLNYYEYDPFGRVIKSSESRRNDFLFVGQWGVMRDVPELYRMRSRYYDAEIGRFISYDPLGYSSLETNLYMYASNNPMMLQDPRGRFAIILTAVLGPAAIGTIANLAGYAIVKFAAGEELSWAGAANAGLSGAITGAAAGALVLVAGPLAYPLVAPFGAIANGEGYRLEKYIDGSEFKVNEYNKAMMDGFTFSWIPFRAPLPRLPWKYVNKLLDGITGSTVANVALKWEKVHKRMKNLYDKVRTNIQRALEETNACCQQPTGAPNSQQPPGVPNSQQPTGAPNSQQRTGAPNSQPPGAPNSQQPTGAPNSQQPPGAPNSQQPTGAPNSQQPPGAPNSQQPPGAPNSQQPPGAPNSQQPPGAPNSQQPTGGTNSQQPTGGTNSQQPTEAPNSQQPTGAPNSTETNKRNTTEDPDVKKGKDDYIEWRNSLDPNDMIGPPGFGDARFIAGDTLLNYEIRFENHPNASAPAQRVLIKHRLDPDLDARTFRIGSFGFGNFTRKLESKIPVLQETLNFESDRNLFVRVTAGIDIVSHEATWDLQSIDPKTGEPPDDPTRGFLPPNNVTTGQGHVTFTIKAREDVQPMSRIDAQASIIFDRNEPIDTPPIFNTGREKIPEVPQTRNKHISDEEEQLDNTQIDSSQPITNLTVLYDTLKTGSLVVMVTKQDIGSGVQSVDIFYQEQDSRVDSQMHFKPLLSDVIEDTAVLPLAQGKSYKLVTAAEDHVGNRQEPEYDRFTYVDFPKVESSCSHLNNCSGRGYCTFLNLCSCFHGYYGNDCGRDKAPLEPPLLEVSSSGGLEDTPIVIHLLSHRVEVNTTTGSSLNITIYGIPVSFNLNRGSRKGNEIILEEEDLGDVVMIPEKDFSGDLHLKITATAIIDQTVTTFNTTLLITIHAKADVPTLVTNNTCADETGIIPLYISSNLTDKDGSENLTVLISGLPDGYKLNQSDNKVNGTHYIKHRLLAGLMVHVGGEFKPFSLKVIALAVEKSNGDTATKVAIINVTACAIQFSCKGGNYCFGHGRCVAQDVCVCDKGFSGHNCSADKAPLEPQLLEVSSSGGLEDTPIVIHLSSHRVEVNTTTGSSLNITIYGIPMSFNLSRGSRKGNEIILEEEDLGDVVMIPEKDFSGDLHLKITATAIIDQTVTTFNTTLLITIHAKADVPTLVTNNTCADETGIIPLYISSNLTDKDGSENLTVLISGLPDGYKLNQSDNKVNGTHYIKHRLLAGLMVHVGGEFKPFSLKVIALAVEKSNGDTATKVAIINVTACAIQYKASLEPQLLEVSSSGGLEDTPIVIHLSSHRVEVNTTTGSSLNITIYGIPVSFNLSRGSRKGNEIILEEEDLGDVVMIPEKDFSGDLHLKITATAIIDEIVTTFNTTLLITIHAKADVPTLVTNNTCADETGIIPLYISSNLTDKDGSENLTVLISGLPDGYKLNQSDNKVNGTHYIKHRLLAGLMVYVGGEFKPFSLKVIALAVEKSNGDTATKVAIINVTACAIQFSCKGGNYCFGHGRCVAQDVCVCDKGFSGHNCSAEIVKYGGESDKTKISAAAIAGGLVGGLILVILATHQSV